MSILNPSSHHHSRSHDQFIKARKINKRHAYWRRRDKSVLFFFLFFAWHDCLRQKKPKEFKTQHSENVFNVNKNTKRCSTPFGHLEIKIKITMRCHYTYIRMPQIKNKKIIIPISGEDEG